MARRDSQERLFYAAMAVAILGSVLLVFGVAAALIAGRRPGGFIVKTRGEQQ